MDTKQKQNKTSLYIDRRFAAVLVMNGLLGILLLLVSLKSTEASNPWNLILAFVILASNIIFYFRSKLQQKAELLILVTWELTIIVEMIYRIARFDRTPFRMLYIPDILCVIFFLDMCKKGKLKFNIQSNMVLLLVLAIGTMTSLFNMRSIWEYIHGVMLIFRAWGLFLYASTTQIKMPTWTKYIFGACIGLFVLETGAGFNVDFRNGIFGYEYVGGMFQLVMVVWLTKSIIADYRNSKSNYFLIKLLIVELIFALREAKSECLLLVIWVYILVFALKKQKSVKVLFYPMLIIFAGVIGWNLIPIFSPKWASVFETYGFWKTANAGITRMFYDNATMRLSDFLQQEDFTPLRYLFGIGFGAAQPPAYYRLIFLPISGLEGDPQSLWLSSLIGNYLNDYAESLVFYRGMYDLIIDMGILGITVFILLLANFLYKAYKLCQCKKQEANMLGAVSIWQILYVVYRMMGYNYLVVPLAMMVLGLMLGMIEYQYRIEYKSRNK